MTITEFLEARIAEDEAVARDASQGRWEVIPRGDQPEVQEVGTDAWLAITSSDPGRPKDANAKHIARHDPARVLAECAAKRAVMQSYRSCQRVEAEARKSMSGDVQEFGVKLVSSGMVKGMELAVQHLAAVYADHPDYRQEWA